MKWDKPYQQPKNQRLDSNLYTHASRIYFITICAYQKQKLLINDNLCKMIIDNLKKEGNRQNCVVFTFCLMPDHLHFLISPLRNGISILTFCEQYKGKTTNLSWKTGWKGKLWQPRHYDHIIRRDESLSAIDEYILDNPVRERLVERAEEWQWSGYINPFPM